jgi:hypothetical protein
MGLFRFAVIFFLVWLITSLFTRYVLPFVVRILFRRMSDRVRRDYDKKMHDKQRKEREGEVTIRYRPDKTKIIEKDDGEYVDYEDIDNK